MDKIKSVCSNQWCKAHFEYSKSDITIVDGFENTPTSEGAGKTASDFTLD